MPRLYALMLKPPMSSPQMTRMFGFLPGAVAAFAAAAQTIGAAQYRQLVRHLGLVLDALGPGAPLDTLLGTFPAAAAVYENRHYDVAGLCRSPLEASLNSELKARSVINKARG